jgi:sn-glycerol 3-phosphate transport system substrate-binding protein
VEEQTMKRFLSVLILVALVMSFSTSFAQDPVEITFSHIFADETRSALVNEAVAAFEAEHPNITVNVEVAGSYRENLDKALLAAEQGDTPEIVQIFEVGSREALDSGAFTPVSSVATEDQLARIDDVVAPVRNYYTFDNEQWSLPWNSSNPVLYVNVDKLAAAGVEAIPQTYDEVLAACETIMSQAEALNIQGCIGWNMHSWFVEQWMSQAGAILVNNDNGRSEPATEALLDSEAMLRHFTWWKALADNGYYIYSGAVEDWDGSDAIFTGQQDVFHITSTADLVNITNAATEAGFEVQTAFMPIPDGVERNGTVVGGASLWLGTGHTDAENEAAVELMLYLSSPEQMAKWARGTGYFAVTNSAIALLDSEGFFTDSPNAKVTYDQMTNTILNPASAGAVTGVMLEIRTIIEEAGQSVVDAGVDPADALAEADDRADQAIEDYNAALGG